MTAGDRLFCDTNVLLSAVDRKRALNPHALHLLNVLPNRGIELCLSGQIVREFLAVCTRPVEVNGLGLSTRLAVQNVKAILERSTLLEETHGVSERLLRIAHTTRCSGKRLHDANVVATIQEHGLARLVTDNLSDFREFHELELVDLVSVRD